MRLCQRTSKFQYERNPIVPQADLIGHPQASLPSKFAFLSHFPNIDFFFPPKITAAPGYLSHSGGYQRPIQEEIKFFSQGQPLPQHSTQTLQQTAIELLSEPKCIFNNHISRACHKKQRCAVILARCEQTILYFFNFTICVSSNTAGLIFFDLQARATSEIAVADLSDSENR